MRLRQLSPCVVWVYLWFRFLSAGRRPQQRPADMMNTKHLSAPFSNLWLSVCLSVYLSYLSLTYPTSGHPFLLLVCWDMELSISHLQGLYQVISYQGHRRVQGITASTHGLLSLHLKEYYNVLGSAVHLFTVWLDVRGEYWQFQYKDWSNIC